MKTALLTLLFLLIQQLPFKAQPQFQDGDIIFQTSKSSQSLAIQRATKSRYSHMGIILIQKGTPYVLEAIEPVSLTPLSKWINRGQGGRYEVKRLINAPSVLTPKHIDKMIVEGKRLLGKHYDSYFEWSDEKQYCSELVYKVYERALNIRLCQLRRMKTFNLTDPQVQKKLHERYGNKIPLEEQVVAPSDIYDSPLLVTVPCS